MAGTIIDYLKEYGDCPLTEMPLNHVDSLILCQLSYLKYDGMVRDVRSFGASVSVRELAEHKDFERLFSDSRYEKPNRALFQGILGSRRFGNMRLNCYINMVEKEWETQFAAVTFLLEDGTIYIAFRGTDETIVGWKEDFNMAFLSPIPGQSYSVKYLNMVTSRLRTSFYVGGHSKGGNLAVYSAMKCLPEVQKRIKRVYCMDGPGFRPEILECCGYHKIEERVIRILPHSSIVGMLFEMGMDYQVVESNRLGLAQHDPFTWQVEGDAFVYAEDIYEGRRFVDETINEWILSLNEQQLKTFVNTLYQVISASGAEDLITFAADWRGSMNRIMAALKNVDEQTAEILKKIIKSLFEIMGSRLKAEVKQNIPAKTAKIRSRKGKETAGEHRKSR